MIDWLVNLDKSLFLVLNGWHSPFWDFVMYWLSDRFIWIPLYAFLLLLIIKKYKKQAWIVIISVILLIVLTDQISTFLKNAIERPRPCHNLSIQGLVYTLNGNCGGSFGFVSSHATNSFGLATMILLLFHGKIKLIGLIMIIWASLVSFSRIYLGVHYPLDIAGGFILGTSLAILIFYILSLILQRIKT